MQHYRCQQALYALQFSGCIALKPGNTPSRCRRTSGDESRLRGRLTPAASGSKVALTHQADARHPRPSSTYVLRLSRTLVRQLNSQSEWSDGRTNRWAPTPIQHVESAEKSWRGPTSADGTEHTEKTYSADEQKLPDSRPSAWCVLGLKEHYLRCHSRNFCKTCLFL